MRFHNILLLLSHLQSKKMSIWDQELAVAGLVLMSPNLRGVKRKRKKIKHKPISLVLLRHPLSGLLTGKTNPLNCWKR